MEKETSVLPVAAKPINKSLRWLLIVAGHLFVLLGIIGAILPLMPTTIFLILAGYCYARSSERFHCWLYSNKFFGNHLKNYKEKKGTPLSVKVGSIAVLWGSILISWLTTDIPWVVVLILLAVGVGVTIHLILIKTYKKEPS